MAYRTVPFPMTLSDFEGHAPIENLLKFVFCTFVWQLTRFQLPQCTVWYVCRTPRVASTVWMIRGCGPGQDWTD